MLSHPSPSLSLVIKSCLARLHPLLLLHHTSRLPLRTYTRMAHESATKLALADGQDETVVLPRVLKLTTTSATTSLSSSESFDAEHPWTLVKDGKGLTRTFRFKTFKDTWAFMSAIAEQCKRAKHHPEWFNSYNRTDITWTTHRPEGLTIKDVEMAEYCDQQGREVGEVKLGEETANCATGKKK